MTVKSVRARDLGISFKGITGNFNAITDVAGVKVGYSTIIDGEGELIVGKGPVRTGVTAILPRGQEGLLKNYACFAAWHSLNGNGEMTGTTWIEESGLLEGPVMITNTHSVGIVRDSVIKWYIKNNYNANKEFFWLLPVVAETYDGMLNDINGFHVKESNVYEALDTAKSGIPEEGNVGGGTGMVCHEFKGGTGTSSRVVSVAGKRYTIGALVQANYGRRQDFTLNGIPAGHEYTDSLPEFRSVSTPSMKDGSIIVVLATDAPLLPHQLKRLAKRIPIGIGRLGGFGSHTSGDIFLAFSTCGNIIIDEDDPQKETIRKVESLTNELINGLLMGTIEVTEEAILNALVAAKTMEGINRNRVYSASHDTLMQIIQKYRSGVSL